MIIAGKYRKAVYECWVPDYSNFVFPIKKDGSPYLDVDEDYENYLDWLVDYLESNNLELNEHHQDIVSVEKFDDFSAGHIGLILGAGASYAVNTHNVADVTTFPDDYLLNPNPKRIAEQDIVEGWIEDMKNHQDYVLDLYDNREEMEADMIGLEDFFIFNFMYQKELELYDINSKKLPNRTAKFSDVGWRSLLKKAISRTNDFEEKREALKSFHREYDYISWK
jgi:hypothetical protein